MPIHRSARPPRVPLVALLALPLLLAACTGTEETSAPLRLVLLTDGGSVLRAVTPSGSSGGNVTVTEDARESVTGGVNVTTPTGGQRVTLTRAAGTESRAADLSDPRAYPDPAYTPRCTVRAAQNAARDRLLILSDCGGVQNLAMYQNAALQWTAALPTALQPAPGSDTPPTRVAVQLSLLHI
ncbi:hypothetical protein [Deinococcus aquaticus]|uniref:hypothetical protein n=1 Tax=Deinococcus aquaticus TaxID=328692 RepID=UPI003F4699E5